MLFKSRFLFDDAAGDKGGGGGDDAAKAAADAKIASDAAAAEATKNSGQGDKGSGDGSKNNDAKPEPAKPFFTAEELKELGVENETAAKDLLRQLKAKDREANLPDADKLKKQNLEKAEFLKYSAENDLYKVEDYNKLESIKSKSDKDLVYENWFPKWKEENPGVAPDQVESLAKEEFEEEYRLNSTNEKTKNRGIDKLKREASELRSPLEKSYNSAYERFSEDKKMLSKIPEFNKFMDELIKEATPDKVVLFKTKEGEEEIAIDVELTKEQKDELGKTFKNAKVFSSFATNEEAKLGEWKAKIQKKIEGFIKINNFEAANKKSYDAGKGVGTKQGSNTGADNSFALQENGKRKDTPVISLEDSNKKIAEARERYRASR